MKFRDLLKKIKGLHIKYGSGMARVEEVYWETNTAMLLVDAGTRYSVFDEYKIVTTSFISDGTDRVIVDLFELDRMN